MSEQRLEFKVSKKTNVLRLIVLSIALVLSSTLFLTLAYKNPKKILMIIILMFSVLIRIILRMIVIVRNINYRFIVIGNKIIEEYNNEFLINTIRFDGIEGIKRGGGALYVGKFYLNPSTSPDESFPIIYGKLNGDCFEFIPKITPDWNDFLGKMRDSISDLEIDPTLARYVSIDKQKKIFGRMDSFQIFFIVIFIIGFIVLPLVLVLLDLIKNN